MSPSRIRAKMDCPVVQGVVERRLSQLELAQFSGTPRQDESTDEKVKVKADNNFHFSSQSDNLAPTEDNPPLMISLERAPTKLPTRTQLPRSPKLQCQWPPVRDTQKNQQWIDQRKHQTSREIQCAISGRSSGGIKETRHVYENTCSCAGNPLCNNSMEDTSTCNTVATIESLSPTRSPTKEEHQPYVPSPGRRLPPKRTLGLESEITEVHGDHETDTVHLKSSTTPLLHHNDPAEGDFPKIVLPSGQRLPPPKGRTRTRRRANYRIRYRGPTLLRLEDVYGKLLDIPEVDQRFSSEYCDEGPLKKPMRSCGVLHPLQARRRSRDDRGSDFVRSCSTPRQHYDDNSCVDTNTEKDKEDELVGDSMSEEEMYSINQPDVWIAPLKSLDGSRKWKVKRVWDVDDVDADELEYEVEYSDLMFSIRDLLGVPNDLGGGNPWDTSADKDMPPELPHKPTFTVETVYDVGGHRDGGELCVEMTAATFVSKMNDIIGTTDHNLAAEDVQSDHSNTGGPQQRTFVPPVAWVSAQDGQVSPERRSRNSKSVHKRRGKFVCKNSINKIVNIQRREQATKKVEGSATVGKKPKDNNEEGGRAGEGKRLASDRKPTWEKEATGSPKKGKEEIKMWWHQ
ncbi:hypothetical protein IV203_006736 [Nitzschia inconspicua]|uniref:Uncharacterized protein n=1 Tax=Nitzschia inconspicua TaxID=303405 RepID=A0A9K3K7X5_9STRA|nr:hypothetical protein IV203_006736 [Nitzschia inconspicua]